MEQVFSPPQPPSKMNNDTMLRNTPFFRTTYQPEQPFSTSSSAIIYQLTSLANPFIPLIEVYSILAVPTSKLLTQELMQFMRRCVLEYKIKKQLPKLLSEFISVGTEKGVRETIQNSLNLLMSKTTDQLLMFSLEDYPTSLSCLEEQISSDQSKYLLALMQNNLKKYRILVQSVKIQRIKRLNNKLKNQFETELIIDQSKKKVALKFNKKSKIARIMTLEEVLNDGRSINIDVDNVDVTREKIFSEIMKFHTSVINIYDDSHEAYFKVHPSNVLVYIKQQREDQFVLGEEMMGLDLIQVFLNQMGLEGRPTSIQQNLVFHGTPHPPMNHFDFVPAIKSIPKKSGILVKENQIESIMCWLLFFDTLHSRYLYTDKLTVYETSLNANDVLRAFQSKDNSVLSSETIAMLVMMELESNQENMLINYTYLKWKNFLMGLDIKEDPYFSLHKFQRAKMIMNVQERLFLEQDRIKNTIQKNRFLIDFQNVGRYAFLYITSQYPLLTFQWNLLKNNYSGQDIMNDKYRMRNDVEKFVKVGSKIEKKIEEDYKLRDLEDSNKVFMSQNGSLFDTYENLREERAIFMSGLKSGNIRRSLQELQQLMSNVQRESWKLMYQTHRNRDNDFREQFNKDQQARKYKAFIKADKKPNISQYLPYCRCQIQMQLYFSYSIQNYSACKYLEAQLADLNTSLQNTDVGTIDTKFQKFRQKMVYGIKNVNNIASTTLLHSQKQQEK